MTIYGHGIGMIYKECDGAVLKVLGVLY